MFNKKNIKYLKYIILIFIIFFIASYFTFKMIQIKKHDNYKNINKVVNIVFTTDKNYTEYTKVAILSAIMNKKEDSIYNINILCVDLPENKSKEFSNITKNFKNVNLKTIPLTMEKLKGIGEYEVSNHVSRADLFKFFIPDLFPDLDKMLYLDGDVLVLHDLTDLFNTDISNAYIGAVKKYQYQTGIIKKDGKYIYEQYYTYNCGVLLFNMNKWRESNIKKELIKAKNNDVIRDLVTQKSFNDCNTT